MKVITGVKLILNAFFRGDEYCKFILAEKISGLVYPRYKFSEFGRLYLYDDEFISYYMRFDRSNFHSLDRKYALDQLMNLVSDVEGDTVECGAYQGASSSIMCRKILGTLKKHHIFDSFEGLSVPHPEDGLYWKKGDLVSSEDAIRKNLREFDFIVYHKGWIPEKFHQVNGKRFSFVHIDVDLYKPTLDSLEFFYEKVNPGGIILCDDYGFNSCPGAKQAFDSFFCDKPEKLICLPTGQCFVMRKNR